MTLIIQAILLFIDLKEYQGIFLAIAGVLGVIWMWKAGIIQELTGGQKKLIDLRSAELTQSREENTILKARIKELEEYNRLLIMNSRTTMEVAMQIKQQKGVNE